MKKVLSIALLMVTSFSALTWCLCQVAYAEPILSVAPMSVKMGTIPVGGTSPSKTVIISNKGTSDLSIVSVMLSGTNASEFSQTSSCAVIPAKGTCSIAVTFTPTAPFGKKEAFMSVVSNDPKKPTVTVKLSGHAPPPKISASSKSVNLGSVPVGGTSAKTITVKNTGVSDLVILSITITGTNASEFSQSNNCSVVPAKSSCAVAITFIPTVPFGKKDAVMSIVSNDPKKQTLLAKISGQAPPPKISASPMSVNLGSIPVGNSSPPKRVTVKNTGISDLIINSIVITGADPSEFSQTNDCSILAKGGYCSIGVILHPTSAGSKSGVLTISSTDPKKPTVNVKLAGTGSGTGGLFSLGDLAGQWELNSLASGPGAPWWERGTLIVDPDGTCAGSLNESTGSIDNLSGRLSISSNGAITLSSNPSALFQMDSDKTIIVGTSTWTGFRAGTTALTLLTKKAVACTTADLVGTWNGHSLASGPEAPWWERGTLTIYQDGTFTASTIESTGTRNNINGRLSITPDGIITFQGADTARCALDSGKTVIVCTATWLEHQGTTELKVFTRKAGSYSMADLVGTWDGNSLASGPGAPWWERGTLTIYQDGTFTASTTESTGSQHNVSGRFTISPAGVISIPGSDTAQCALDSGKTFVVCTDTWSGHMAGSSEMKVLIK